MALRHGYNALGLHTAAALVLATMAITTRKQIPRVQITPAMRFGDPAMVKGIEYSWDCTSAVEGTQMVCKMEINLDKQR